MFIFAMPLLANKVTTMKTEVESGIVMKRAISNYNKWILVFNFNVRWASMHVRSGSLIHDLEKMLQIVLLEHF